MAVFHSVTLADVFSDSVYAIFVHFNLHILKKAKTKSDLKVCLSLILRNNYSIVKMRSLTCYRHRHSLHKK